MRYLEDILPGQRQTVISKELLQHRRAGTGRTKSGDSDAVFAQFPVHRFIELILRPLAGIIGLLAFAGAIKRSLEMIGHDVDDGPFLTVSHGPCDLLGAQIGSPGIHIHLAVKQLSGVLKSALKITVGDEDAGIIDEDVNVMFLHDLIEYPVDLIGITDIQMPRQTAGFPGGRLILLIVNIK